MPDERRSLKVFLCHAHSDKNAVRDLYLRLSRDGIDAWLDKEKLLPGQDWEYEIRTAVRQSDVVVVCLSKQFNEAGFRQKEVRLALDTAIEKPEGEIFIIPARLEECDTLESLRRWHWVDLFEENGYERLTKALQARAKTIAVALHERKPGDRADSSFPRTDRAIQQLEEEIPKPGRLEALESEAIRYELLGDFWNALRTYYKIKRIDPAFPRVDRKIEQLEREYYVVGTHIEKTAKVTFHFSRRFIISLVVVALGLFLGYIIYSRLAQPIRTPTHTPPSIQPAGTGTPCPDEPTGLSFDAGQVVTHTICPEGDTDTFKFSGTSGERVSIKVTYKSGNMRPCVALIAPDNTRTEACENAFNNEIDMTLNQTGSYTIVVDVWFLGTGNYTLVIERF